MLEEKRKLTEYYLRRLKNVKGITPPQCGKDYKHTYQTFACVLDKAIDRNTLIVNLRSVGIEANIGTYSCHMQEVYNTAQKCPNSRYLYEHSIALPLYVSMKKGDIDAVVMYLNKFTSEELKSNSFQ